MPSLNILLTSTAWRNDHNGFSHQGPGLIQNVITHRGDVSRVYLPPDANTLLSVADHCFKSRSYVNLIVIDKQPQQQWLSIDEAAAHCGQGAGIWDWAGNDDGTKDPDVVLACAGDVVTMETVAAAEILLERLPTLRIRVVNVVDLMCLPRPQSHPHGLSDTYFRELFTDSTDVIFTFHGFPGAIHQLVHGRPDADRFHVRGFIEQGTTTTPFDMTVRNRASRYHLVMDAINQARRTPIGSSELIDWCRAQLRKHARHVTANLEDMPEIQSWTWQRSVSPTALSTRADRTRRDHVIKACLHDRASPERHVVMDLAGPPGRRSSRAAAALLDISCSDSPRPPPLRWIPVSPASWRGRTGAPSRPATRRGFRSPRSDQAATPRHPPSRTQQRRAGGGAPSTSASRTPIPIQVIQGRCDRVPRFRRRTARMRSQPAKTSSSSATRSKIT